MSMTGTQEMKCYDVVVTPPAANLPLYSLPPSFVEPGVAFTTGMTCINEIGQGAAVNQRVGNKVVIRSIAHNCILSATATPVLMTVRALLVYDRQTNGTAPTFADILANTAGASGFNAGVNIANRNRFQIIRDTRVTIDDAGNRMAPLKIYAKGYWPVEYGANAGTIGDIRTGAIYLIMFTAQFVANVQVYQNETRIRYQD